jgi:hypothetical protein
MAQTFSYITPADVIYYLVKICHEFGFTQQAIRLAVSGLIEKESALYKELVHYFLNIRFREPSWQAPVEGEAQYPAHFFTSLNDLALCESQEERMGAGNSIPLQKCLIPVPRPISRRKDYSM